VDVAREQDHLACRPSRLPGKQALGQRVAL
jgi:hypothetical protein